MQADYVLDYDVLSAAREHRLYLLARIRAGRPESRPDRVPLNLSVVLDRSSSMIGEKLEYVKQAAQFLVQRLAADDWLSIVTYNETVQIALPPSPVIHKDSINHTIAAVRASGATNLSGGWLQGCSLVEEHITPDRINRILLLTDGLANRGLTEPERLQAMVRQKREQTGVTTTTMGVGLNFNEDLLRAMAVEGGGTFYFIDDADQTPGIFAQELADLLSVVGQNLAITLTLSHDVQMVRQLNAYPVTGHETNVTFQLGDLYADETKILALELFIPALHTLGAVEVGQLRFEYDELGETSVAHRVVLLPITVNTVSAGEIQGDRPANQEVVKPVLMLRAARAREQAVQSADAGDFDGASRVLSDIADAIQKSAIAADPDLQAQHDMLREEALDMEMGAQRYDAYTRKANTTKSYSGDRFSGIEETAALHSRLKSSRAALERAGEVPTLLTWKRQQLALDGVDRLSIGRAETNDIVIPEDEVSAEHCRLIRIEGALYLEDLSSTNGTFANGGRVGGRFRLSVGDIMTVGSWLFMFRA